VAGKAGRPIVLRGIQLYMINDFSEEHYKTVVSMGMNAVRLYFEYTNLEQNPEPYKYIKATEQEIAERNAQKKDGYYYMDQHIKWAKKYGLYVVLDMHVPPGGFRVPEFWDDRALQKRFFVLWTDIAKRYKDEPTVVAYDLANEPILRNKFGGLARYSEVLNETIDHIRSVDKKHTIWVERAYPEGPHTPESTMPAIKDDNVVYDWHMYDPQFFTHQQVSERDGRIRFPNPAYYPSEKYAKAQVDSKIGDWARWGREHNVPMTVGEFGISIQGVDRGGTQWVADVVDAFAREKMSFFYFSLTWKREGKDYSLADPVKRILTCKLSEHWPSK